MLTSESVSFSICKQPGPTLTSLSVRRLYYDTSDSLLYFWKVEFQGMRYVVTEVTQTNPWNCCSKDSLQQLSVWTGHANLFHSMFQTECLLYHPHWRNAFFEISASLNHFTQEDKMNKKHGSNFKVKVFENQHFRFHLNWEKYLDVYRILEAWQA